MGTLGCSNFPEIAARLVDGGTEDLLMLADMLMYIEAWPVLGDVIGLAKLPYHAPPDPARRFPAAPRRPR